MFLARAALSVVGSAYTVAVRLILVVLAALAAPDRTAGQQILEIYGKSLTSYRPASSSAGQSIRPRADQKGVNLDGSVRAPSPNGWAIGGNPFGEGTVPGGRLGDVNLCSGT